MPQTAHNETVLVSQAINGDAEAFGELYQMYHSAIYRYIFPRVENPHDAEDLTQQVYLQAWKAMPSYQQRGRKFSSWLYRIAHNVIISHHRRQQQTVPITQVDTNEHWQNEQPTTLDQVIEAEEIKELSTALTQLPEAQQQIVKLRFMDGLNHAEIAQTIDKSAGASRVIQHRALATLNKLMKNPATVAVGTLIACLIWLLIGGLAVIISSSRALPGDTLYPLKTWGETIPIAISQDKLSEAQSHLDLASKRLSEVKTLTGQSRIQDIESTLEIYDKHIEVVMSSLEMDSPLAQEDKEQLARQVIATQSQHETTLNDLLTQVPWRQQPVVASALATSNALRSQALIVLGQTPIIPPASPSPTPTAISNAPTVAPSTTLEAGPGASATLSPTNTPEPTSSQPEETPQGLVPPTEISATATATDSSSAKTATLTLTATPTATASPTETPHPPTATSTPTASATPSATSTATATATATATPVPPTSTPTLTSTPIPPTATQTPISRPDCHWPNRPDNWPQDYPWEPPEHWPEKCHELCPWPQKPVDWPDNRPWPKPPENWSEKCQ